MFNEDTAGIYSERTVAGSWLYTLVGSGGAVLATLTIAEAHADGNVLPEIQALYDRFIAHDNDARRHAVMRVVK